MPKAKEIPTGGGGSVNWTRLALILVLALPAMVVLLPTTVMVFVLALPTIVAFLVDRTKERYLVATVGLLNLCGLLPAVIALWDMGQSFDALFRLLADMLYWLIAFGAAGVGWAVFISLPPMVSAYYAMISQHRIQQLRKRQKQLIEEWGEEVAGRHRGAAGDDADEGEPAAPAQ